MGLSGSKRPTTPIIIPDPRRLTRFFVLRSPEVVLALASMVVSFYLLITATRDDHFGGGNGLWHTFNRKSRARMQSREAELLPDPPNALSADMVLVIICAMSCNAFLNACGRVMKKEQNRIEEAEEEKFRLAAEDPATRKDALAARANLLAERIKVWEENDKRRKENRPVKRERLMHVDVMADEMLTNIIVVASVTLAVLTGYFVQMQTPNPIRGLGAGAMLMVLMGGLMVCGSDRQLNGLYHYCNYVNLLCMACMLYLFARATVLAQK